MKTLKVNQIEKNQLSAKEQEYIKGGNSCSCGCHGPSSISANQRANYNGNLWSDVNKAEYVMYDRIG